MIAARRVGEDSRSTASRTRFFISGDRSIKPPTAQASITPSPLPQVRLGQDKVTMRITLGNEQVLSPSLMSHNRTLDQLRTQTVREPPGVYSSINELPEPLQA